MNHSAQRDTQLQRAMISTLKHWGWNNMAAILQMIFSNKFSLIKIIAFSIQISLKFYSLSRRIIEVLRR